MKAIAMTLLLGVHAHAADNRWALNGPDGGRIDSATASNGALYASTHRNVYKSVDGGLSWFSASTGLKALIPGSLRLAAHPTQPDTLALAGATSVFMSTDGGRNWNSKRTGLPNGLATLDVAFAYGSASQLWLASRNGLWRSVDGGERWTAAAVDQLPANIERVAVDPADGNRILVWAGARNSKVFPAGLYQSTDGGNRFIPVEGPWDNNGPARADLFAFNPNTGGQFFLAGSFGSFALTEGGRRVNDLSNALGGARLQSLAAAPMSGGRMVFGTSQGIMVSDDSGASFALQRGAATAVSVRNIAIDPQSNGRWVAFAASGDVLVTADAGRGWSSAGNGLRGNAIAAIAAQPLLGTNLLAGVRSDHDGATALYRSDNNGASWSRSSLGLGLDSVAALAFDPGTASVPSSVRVYAAGSDIAGSGATTGGVFVSNDSGRTWSSSANLLPAPVGGIGAVNALLIDTASTRRNVAQTLYFAADGRVQCNEGTPKLGAARIWRSIDAAASWQPIDGLPLGACKPKTYGPRAVALAYLGSDRIVAGTRVDGYCASCGDSVPTIGNGVFVFSGGRWVEANAGLPRMSGSGAVWDVTALAAAGGALYAGLRDPSSPALARVYRSDDGGLSWVRSDTGVSGAEVRALYVDAAKPNRVFASLSGSDTAPGGVFRSTDGGSSWASSSIDLPSDGGGALALTQTGGVETLHTGTGQGAWRSQQETDIDADGASDATEDLAPNGGDGNNDGLADRSQSGVATVSLDVARGAAQQGTLSDIQLRPTIKGSGVCTQVVNVSSLSSESVPSDPDLIQGRAPMQFEFVDCPYALVEIVYHNFTFTGTGWQLRRYGPTVVGDPSSFAWQTVSGAVISGNTVVFPLTDNTAGDHQSQSDRIFSIVVPVQPE